MYEQHLQQAGLNKEQAEIYEILIKNGPLKAGKISQKTTLKRGLVYKILDQLLDFGLIEKKEEAGKPTVFIPAHPLKLKELSEKREQKAKDAQLALSGILPSIVSDFNLVSGQPGIQFFEGVEGVKKISDDSLTAKTEILSYVDNEAVNKYIGNINQEYRLKRDKLKIKKRMITIDSEYIQKRKNEFDRQTTDIHLIESNEYPFSTIMQIYDNKISYITLDPKKMISVLIEDEHIVKMHKTLFEYMWSKTRPLFDDYKKTPTSAYQIPKDIA